MTKMTTLLKLGVLFIGAASATALAAACAGGSTTSHLAGGVAHETFSEPIDFVMATGETGATVQVSVDADGRFRLPLEEGSVYQITLVGQTLRVPLVLGGRHGTYVTGLAVTSGGAEADLGSIRMWSQEVARSSTELGARAPQAADACEGSYFVGSSEPCMQEGAVVMCTDDDDDSDSEDNDDQEGEHDDGDDLEQEGEHEDGQVGGEQVEGPVAVPTYSLNGGLGCDDDDGDSDSDTEDDD